jgi:Icc protein
LGGMLKVIHLSDTHFSADPGYRFGGVARPRVRVEAVVAAVEALEFKPDLVVHTGDMTEDETREAYGVAVEVFGGLGMPIYCVPGNHDDGRLLREAFPPAGVEWLTGNEEEMAYVVEREGHRLVMLDGTQGEAWRVPEGQLEALAGLLGDGGAPVTVWMHYPALPVGCPWVDGRMLLENGEALHEVLRGAGPQRVQGVFCGHIHRSLKLVRDGIFYCAVGSACAQIRVGPGDEGAVFEGEAPLWFNSVEIGEGGVMVREFAVGVPEGE